MSEGTDPASPPNVTAVRPRPVTLSPSRATPPPPTLSPLVSRWSAAWHSPRRTWNRERPGGAHASRLPHQGAPPMSAQLTSPRHTRIAHLSDVHMLDDARTDRLRARGYDLSTHFVSIGRRLDPVERR